MSVTSRPAAGPAQARLCGAKRGNRFDRSSSTSSSHGEYKVLVAAKVGIGQPPSAKDGYVSFPEVGNLKVAAPQFVILFGALVGLISWLLFPQGRDKAMNMERMEWTMRGVGGLLSQLAWYLSSIACACLLAAIVTVLLTRISESQFLVKISITNFWGAVVVGSSRNTQASPFSTN